MKPDCERSLFMGGATGIGRAGARSADINADDAERTVDTLRSSGGKAWYERCDVSDEVQVREVTAHAAARMGGVDAAALAVDDIEANAWAHTLHVNLAGSFYCVKHGAAELRRSGAGVVILFGSSAGLSLGSASVPYAVSKGGIFGLAHALTPSLEEDGIRVHALVPSSVDTPLKRKAEAEVAERRGSREWLAASADGVGRVVRFIAQRGSDKKIRELTEELAKTSPPTAADRLRQIEAAGEAKSRRYALQDCAVEFGLERDWSKRQRLLAKTLVANADGRDAAVATLNELEVTFQDAGKSGLLSVARRGRTTPQWRRP